MDWKERFEVAVHEGDTRSFCTGTCQGCPFEPGNANCLVLFPDDTEAEKAVLMGIYRHVLATVKDFTDVDEIRARVAEMLDDDAREKFLGRAEAEPEPRYRIRVYHDDLVYRHSGSDTKEDPRWPKHRYSIWDEGAANIYHRALIVSCRDEDTTRKVAAFLNGPDSA